MKPARRCAGAFTLMEALVSMLLLGIMVTGVVSGFIQTHRIAEWGTYNLAAQSLAMQPIEQSRAAKWNPNAAVPIDELVATNFPMTTNVLDVPISGTNKVYATNSVSIRTISADPPLRMISVQCTWSFPNRGVFSNGIWTYRAPDQ